MLKIKVTDRVPETCILSHKQGIYNFFNLNTVWWLKNSKQYYLLLKNNNNINFTDSKILSVLLRTKQQRGPTFTKKFLSSVNVNDTKHFFIGLDEQDKILLSKKTKLLENKVFSYNPPYIKELEFSKLERKTMISKLKKIKPSFVWVCVGSPKQEILSNQLYKDYKATYLNVGAALDFILERKKEAPKIFQRLCLEWFYRLITDFKYSKKKVWKSLLGLKFLNILEVKR